MRVFVLILLFSLCGIGQVVNVPSVKGFVKDSDGSLIVDASVVLSSEDGRVVSTKTTDKGYSFVVPSGIYSIEVDGGSGFGRQIRGPFTLGAKTSTLDFVIFPERLVVSKYNGNSNSAYDDIRLSKEILEDLTLQNTGRIRTGKIRYGKKERCGEKWCFTTSTAVKPGKEAVRARPELTYNLFSIHADRIEFDPQNRVIVAIGNPIEVDNGVVHRFNRSVRINVIRGRIRLQTTG